MQKFIKDHSFVNRIIFPAPESQYTVDSFPRQLCWIPRDPNDRPDHETFGEEPLPTTDNRVPCLWLPFHRPSKRVILYAHGNGEDLGNTHRFVRMLRDHLQCHVMAAEYPGYGISPGVTTESSVNDDMHTVFNFLIDEMGFKTGDVLLFGRSIGSGPSCQIASRYRVGGLVLVSAFSSIRDMARHLLGRMAAAIVADRFSNIEAIASSEAPVLLIHGLADDLIPYSHSQQLFRASEASSRRAIHFPEEMDHNNFNLKEDILLPIKLHFPDFFVRGSLHHKSLIPAFAFLKPIEYSALREKRRHPPPLSPSDVDYGSSSLPPSPPDSKRSSPAPGPRNNFEYEKQLAHLSMMYPDLDDSECQHVLKLCKGNLARAAEIVVRLNLAAAGPTVHRPGDADDDADPSSSSSASASASRSAVGADNHSSLNPDLHVHLNRHRHNGVASASSNGGAELDRDRESKENAAYEAKRNPAQSPAPSPPESPSPPDSQSPPDSPRGAHNRRSWSLDVEYSQSMNVRRKASLSQSQSQSYSMGSNSAPHGEEEEEHQNKE